MIEWSEQHLMIRDAVRRFVDEEIVPNLEELEHGDLPPYDILRKLYSTFGIDELNRTRFDKMIAKVMQPHIVPSPDPRIPDLVATLEAASPQH